MKNALLFLTLSLSAATALAQTPPPSPFEQHKAKLVAHIQDHIAKQQTLLACVQAAQNRAAIKACKRAQHSAH